MFVFKNAWKSVIRNKGRNILIAIIVAIIAAAATIGLSIRQAANSARETGLENTSVTGQISVDRSKLISASSTSGSSSSSGQPDFSAIREALSDKELKLSDYQKYAKLSSVASSYYTETSSLAKTDSFQAVSTTSSDSSSSSSESSNANAQQGPGGGMGGGMEATTVSGDFQLVGFSSDQAVKNASNGSFTMTSGEVFGYDATDDNEVIISKSLADFNNLKVGSTISAANPSDSSKTYTLKVVGIYKNSTETSGSTGGPGNSSTASDPANAIYTSVATLKALGLDASSTLTTTDSSGTSSTSAAAQISYTYVFSNKSDYTNFKTQATKAGLNSDYSVSSSDVEEYESSLVPLNNLSQFALTLLLIVLGVGAVVLIVLSLFNVRERKYEVGVLTAMGVKKTKVAAQFAIELLIVTMIGLGIGAIAGAATSVPVSNQLLASQVAQQESESSSQQAQFGRGMQGGGAGSNSSGTGSGSSNSGSNTGGNSGSTTQAAPSQSNGGPGRIGTRAVSYVSSINSTVSLSMVGQLVLIGLGLTLLSALVGVIFVMRYEPLQILADRS
ncbi:ABC transporter permease [Bifidobacterium crudilactis]|jgi:putative ABC transport system permease protein|uniref:ABC transporter permease n=1 Tax=Bifidobacterium crudilactis TaxID=327277 RepID=A0A971IDP6_9BIFI|nr:ABC transporter permease [Bifidobacterium crudilactis]MCI1868026.1 ABC transporter permease [Bifidobacterium crudilactis]MDN5971558.1 ABC transporter permease [Bifidobacterium crudilactis]MDN6209693.1 ABC transporter permease [Bifidobacterium crudilactis]MDN6458388.1 ABC transporter permease [Bifidobacterium crudilactis]MDN6466386.1 ABC transporter permease [Bifidobacterium crudilactis]